MQTVDEELETIHVYVVREEAPRPSLLPIFLSAVALSILVAFCMLTPYQQPVTRAVIRVPAVPLTIKTFIAQMPVIPTGVHTYPATTAHGTLTITNGSIIGQVIPAGFTVSNVATDYAVYVPPGTANGYGYATVRAHALISGKSGNFARLAVNQVIGSSVYIRNLSAFTGGKDSHAVKFATAQDKQTALLRARGILFVQIGAYKSKPHYPCKEAYLYEQAHVTINWRCQFIAYHIPAFYHVTGIRLAGKNLIVDVWFVSRPIHIWVK